ncbi:MAG: preprotein translocase subunit SecA [Zetaproteobacteria bacterium CG_4_9_14_3_um_filter_49_83]|nr:MAG: preprotein translocase subunit SecA [Zetaproteobacteria bacterium CG17_big_fil_post_rev_8_21_14_2_50_50_13]PIV31003.1 MAG: preprotein translocase subunit SecA [Zetaproteobacteria bacterium CG02_land_8_20_14_3_00_50_9]PIY55163.1 MAG: preprotein translocase subunit SecA [Zetaproteobacteria bacterium CG_4_10_14_0_8_um_filter_49_80]PJA35116.1 MAG: preprotein translocase subunit SecA [Zetaproteobacteria bacterium CG_4_9_14_3_um_filter_49_83]
MQNTAACPCGSGQAAEACCRRWLDGDKPAPSAEALMRSRYTAYVLNRHEYLLATWYPSTRPATLGGTSLHWIGLEIVHTEQGGEQDSNGIVEFIASYVQRGKGTRLHERSRFVRESMQGEHHWLYVDGDCRVSDIARNDACPCGSGKKFKRCCMGV